MRLTSLLLTLAMTIPAATAADDDYAARMAVEHEGDLPVAAAAADATGSAEGREVTYAELDGSPVKGYLAGSNGGAGVIVIQEWWGLNDNIRAMARELASEGYTALAVDLYEGEVADDSDGAMKLVRASMETPERLADNLRQAYDYLVDEVGVETVGVIGWCFGGGWSLQTAIMLGDDLDAAVIYYGRLETDPAKLESVSAAVLGLFGEDDGGIPVTSVRAFESAMQGLGRDVTVHVYPGADHAFANPSGTRYQPEAAADAWVKTLAFFERHLR